MSDTLYGKIVNDLVEKIETGFLPLGSKMPTETELAQEYYVSRITSRRALNELAQSGYVTRKRRAGTFVIRNSLRGANPSSGTRVIGLVFPFTSFTLDGQNCLNGVMEVSNRYNYYTVVKNSLANYRIEQQIIEKYISDQIDGIIYYPVDSESNFLQIAALQACHCPIVTIDKTIDGTDISSVTSDNWQGSLDAMRHLFGAQEHRFLCRCFNQKLQLSQATLFRLPAHAGGQRARL